MTQLIFSRARSTFLILAIIASLGACSKPSEQSTSGKFINDATLTAKIKAELLKDDGVKGLDIHVETNQGIVQLDGSVGSESARERAEQLASSTNGVLSVRNNLSVQAAKPSVGDYVDDAAITAKVKMALLGDAEVKGLAIDVATSDGTVRLTGSAKSDAERQKAEELAKDVKGVNSVQNRIAVN
jgi:hyperosmotically inducible periplasmic protein